MRKSLTIFALIFCALITWAQDATKTIKGTVSYLDKPLVNADVSLIGSGAIVKTDLNGAYEIAAKEGETIVFSYPSMRAMEIVVEDVTRILNIQMNQEVNALDEVVVTKTARKSQKQLREEYYVNKNLINTVFGIIDKEAVGYHMKIIEGKDIPLGHIDFVSALQGRYPGLRIERFLAQRQVPGNALASAFSEPRIFFRGAADVGFRSAIYDVDGIIFNSAPTFIAVENIERLAIIGGLNSRYGAQGNGGVIVINTKGAIYAKTDSQIPIDLARLRNNYHDESTVLNSEKTAKDAPLFLLKLQSCETENDALALYDEQFKTNSNSFHNALVGYDYFVSQWKNQEFADKIINDNFNLFYDNPIALKALAYYYQVQDRNEEALELFKEVAILRPNYSQSYMDLANAYREVGDYQRAASIFVRYGYLIEEGFLRAKGKMFTNMIDREFNNLVALKGKKILKGKDHKDFVLDEEFNGTRLVFEWSNSEAEFELQFVNPENQYYNSKHSLKADAKRIKDEKLSGYSSEEYLIDDSIRGTWLVNVKYLGNKSLTPTYMKATIYHNYGSASQRKETKLFKMSLRNVNQQWFEVSNAATIASN